jgi:hypothetical protein
MGNLNAKYGGSLNKLHDEAADSMDLEKRLKKLGKGIGDVTVSIFLRELRSIWRKADPKPTSLVILAARKLGIVKTEEPQEALEELKAFWRKNKIEGKSFVNFETALLRYGKDLRRKKTSRSEFRIHNPYKNTRATISRHVKPKEQMWRMSGSHERG